jgi:hypothetical protein
MKPPAVAPLDGFGYIREGRLFKGSSASFALR